MINVKPQAPTFKFLVDFCILVFDFFQLFLKIVLGGSPPPPILSCHNNLNFSMYFICNRNTDLHGIL